MVAGSFMSSLSWIENAMFSLTYTERLFADKTKNTTKPKSSNTNVVLMLEVMNCILKKDPAFLLMAILYVS